MLVGPKSVERAWDGMAEAIGLPGEGEGGMKLIRRSMADLLLHRGVPHEQVEVMLGHRPISSTSVIYTPYRPGFMAEARAEIEKILDEIAGLVPGALRSTCAQNGGTVIPLRAAANG